MSSWMNDAAVQNHNGAGFNPLNDSNTGGNMIDPSAFMATSSSFDPNQFQTQQLQQRMQNGGMRNGSPAFNNPVYQTNPVIPSKRPRPREDSLGTSPRQAPGMLPNSRSQTPQQGAYPGFQANNVPSQHAPQQTPYSHLQNGSSNASPSPIMANQLRPGGVPQRVSTASPHPFSPSQSDHGSRVDTPQSASYNQNPPYTPGFNQNFTPPPGRTSAPLQNSMSTPQMPPHMPQTPMYNQQSQPQPHQSQQKTPSLDQTRQMYQMRLQQQLQQQQQGNFAAQRQNMPPSVNPISQGQMMQAANGQYSGMRPQQPSMAQNPPQNNFLKNLTAFMQSKGYPLEVNPFVGDRNISIGVLYMAVSKFGGYRLATQQNAWPQISQIVQIHPARSPNAPQQLKTLYENNLLAFEDALASNMQRQRAAAMKQGGNVNPQQMSPTKQMTPPNAMQSPLYMQQQQQMALQQQHAQTTPMKQMTPLHHAQQPIMNGFSTPRPPQSQPHHPLGAQGHGRNSLSRSVEATPPHNGSAYPIPSPSSGTKVNNMTLPSPHDNLAANPEEDSQDLQLPAMLEPKIRVADSYSGIDPEVLMERGTELLNYKPDFPSLAEMGTIDIHALTMSLQSGLHAEVRLALDTLAVLSVEYERLPLDLRQCDDLVDSLIDCAEDQIELLAENAAEVSDVMLINSYEDVVRACIVDTDSLRDIPAFGTLDYILDRAVDKLICIMSIMRNLSFFEQNQPLLAEEFVVKFICVVIRYIGTRNMLLRTNQNTLDFMKDGIILLSNLAHEIKLPGREQALCLLHFLLAFAPCPPPNVLGSDRITFSPYNPTLHYYLYPAVDSLAKLLARDEPNRTHYKTIFASDVASSPPFDLLTRTFALSVSAIPDQQKDTKRGSFLPLVEARKPMLMQGMLAAEILSNLAPGYESGIAKAWLTSEDGFANNLSALILSMCNDLPQGSQRVNAVPKAPTVEEEAMLHIILDGIAVLRRLAEKSRDPEDPASMIPIPGMPMTERVVKLLGRKQPRLREALRQLCAFISFGS